MSKTQVKHGKTSQAACPEQLTSRGQEKEEKCKRRNGEGAESEEGVETQTREDADKERLGNDWTLDASAIYDDAGHFGMKSGQWGRMRSQKRLRRPEHPQHHQSKNNNTVGGP